MAQSSGQGSNETQAATSDPQHQLQEQPPQTTPSRSQTATDEQQAAITNPSAQRKGYCVSVWATGGYLEVDVGEGKYVPVPNTHAREPTREEIHQALIAAGYHERADELADRATLGALTDGNSAPKENSHDFAPGRGLRLFLCLMAT
ncbi:hypothetical protein LTR97_004316 [Elasticomyces elasticus]|uniref:Uncharacterized protein n=1 Tax=Elasticomyces elasticus TaxID=574655 RepID=A0AAN7ZNY1_9PEZI|nr:hypothetical protein LTR97_004316 [Elasticomyces elasticus]